MSGWVCWNTQHKKQPGKIDTESKESLEATCLLVSISAMADRVCAHLAAPHAGHLVELPESSIPSCVGHCICHHPSDARRSCPTLGWLPGG
jgi:hypothetical protein